LVFKRGVFDQFEERERGRELKSRGRRDEERTVWSSEIKENNSEIGEREDPEKETNKVFLFH